MLQLYNVQKQSERIIKRVRGQKAEGISSMNSTDYASRFINFIDNVFCD